MKLLSYGMRSVGKGGSNSSGMSELNDPDLNRFYHPLIKTLAKMIIFCPSTGFPTFHMNQLRKIRRHQIIIKLAKSESDTL